MRCYIISLPQSVTILRNALRNALHKITRYSGQLCQELNLQSFCFAQGTGKMKYILLGTVLLMVALCEAHLCLFNPRQRGTMNGINAAGESTIR